MISASKPEQAGLFKGGSLDKPTAEARSTPFPPRKANYVQIFLGAIGFALASAVNLLVRSDAYDFTILNNAIGRYAAVIACILVVVFAGFRLVRTIHLAVIAIVSILLYILIVYVLPLFLTASPYADSVFVNGLAIFLDSLANTFLCLAFLAFLARQNSRLAIACIPLAMAASHALFLVAFYIPGNLVFLLRLFCLIASCLIAAALFIIRKPNSAKTDNNSSSKFFAHLKKPRALFTSLREEITSLNKEFSLIITSAATFPFFYVLVSSLNNASNASPHLYNITAESVGFIALLAIAVVVFIAYNRLNLEIIFVIINLLFATALLLLPQFWGNEVFVSGIMMKTGFIVFNALLWCHIARHTHENISKSLFEFGFATGTLFLFGYFGRLAGVAVFQRNEAVQEIITDTALLAIWVIAISVLVSFLFLRKQRNTQKKSTGLLVEAPEESLDSFSLKCQLFIKSYSLSEREARVLLEFTRGRSADSIAKSMFVSLDTVKTYLRRIYAKADVHSRQELLDRIDKLNLDKKA